MGLLSSSSSAVPAAEQALAELAKEKHWPNESLSEGFPPKAVANSPAANAGLPPIPEFAIPSQHPGSFPPPGGPSAAGGFDIPNMYPTRTIRGFAANSALLQTMSALNVLKDASSQAVSILKGNTAMRTRAEEAYQEALQMDPDAVTKLTLKQLQEQSRNVSSRSERFLHAMASTVRQAELAVEGMKEQMRGFLDVEPPDYRALITGGTPEGGAMQGGPAPGNSLYGSMLQR
ncbi:unnamed protein product [Amoebophrya sp. A120]|nr:unnamed protein product [Amoebophrya sp. A120]|eukprot:GSA120T00000693001.1